MRLKSFTLTRDQRKFLSHPIAVIQEKWRMRAEVRKDLIKNFFDVGEGKAAARDSDLLEQSGFNPRQMDQ